MAFSPAAVHVVAQPRIAAGVIFVDEVGRIMMLRPSYKTYWDIPGGYVEPGESPLAACRREVYEELGIQVPVGSLLSVDWAPHPDEGDKMLFIFDGGTLARDDLNMVHFADGEICEYAFIVVDELDTVTVPRLARRLQSTWNARQKGTHTYLEHGMIPT